MDSETRIVTFSTVT